MLELKNISKTFNKGTVNAKTALDNICNALQERMDEYMAENPDAEVETALTMN